MIVGAKMAPHCSLLQIYLGRPAGLPLLPAALRGVEAPSHERISRPGALCCVRGPGALCFVRGSDALWSCSSARCRPGHPAALGPARVHGSARGREPPFVSQSRVVYAHHIINCLLVLLCIGAGALLGLPGGRLCRPLAGRRRLLTAGRLNPLAASPAGGPPPPQSSAANRPSVRWRRRMRRCIRRRCIYLLDRPFTSVNTSTACEHVYMGMRVNVCVWALATTRSGQPIQFPSLGFRV